MSESNGHGNGEPVIVIGRKGMITFKLSEESPSIRMDVTAVWNEWARIDRSFRTNGNVPVEQMEEHDASSLRFARDHLGDQTVNQAEAWAFIKLLSEEVAKLEDFFTARLPQKQDSPDSGATIVTCD